MIRKYSDQRVPSVSLNTFPFKVWRSVHCDVLCSVRPVPLRALQWFQDMTEPGWFVLVIEVTERHG